MAVYIIFFLFAVQPFVEATNETSQDSECVLTEIESNLNIAFQIIETAKQKIPKLLTDGETGNKTCNNSKCVVTEIMSHLKIASQIIETSKQMIPKDLKQLCKDYDDNNCKECENITCPAKPVDCSDIFLNGARRDGLYDVWPQTKSFEGPIQVYCDMESNGGGWTVIQRRGNYKNPDDYFYKDWAAYKTGFGNMLRDFWIGNDNLFALTNSRHYQLRVNVTDWDGKSAYAIYDEFWTSDELQNYTLHAEGYRGTAGDDLKRHNGQQFTTKDKKNDKAATHNCADSYKGAWWYERCMDSNLNGLYHRGNASTTDGVVWKSFKGYSYSLKNTIMKIRPVGFSNMSNRKY